MEDRMIAEKRRLRKALLAKRGNMVDADAAIAARVFGADCYVQAKTVFVFISVDNEVDTAPIIHRAFADGKKVLVPRTGEGRAMEAVLIEKEEFFVNEWPRSFNIPEPPHAFPAVDVSGIDLVIVPSLAVDRWGYRLGYGGGFYDGFIKGARALKNRPVFAAVQRAVFLRSKPLPREPYDMAVDMIITENEIIIPFSVSA